MITTDYIIADCDNKRSNSIKKKMNQYRSIKCVGSFGKEVELLEKTWLEPPEAVLVYVGDNKLNAFSALRRIKEVTPQVKVVFYSELNEFTADAYALGADYFIHLPFDDIKIGKLVFRYLNA